MPTTTTDYPLPMSRDDVLSTSPFIAPIAALGLPLLAVNPRDTAAPATERDQDWRKAPKDLRTDAERDAAPIRGRGWQAHTLNAATWDTWVHRYDPQGTRAPLNVGVIPGPSVHGGGVMIIDVDDAAESAALDRLWRTWTGEAPPPLTVYSPGVRKGAEGTWAHKGGGHMYVRYSGALPQGLSTTLDIPSEGSKVTVKLFNTYVLAPPSVRAEGPYRWGEDGAVPVQAPAKLLVHIAQEAHRRAQRPQHAGPYEADASVVEWSAQYRWDSVLPHAGYADTGKLDTDCHCPIWQRDGGSSARSLTAHREGCRLWQEHGNEPLYLWTDGDQGPLGQWSAGEGSKRITKLRAVALVFHGGNMRAARIAEGIASGGTRRGKQMRIQSDGQLVEQPAAPASTWTPNAPVEKIEIPTGPAVLVGAVIPLSEQTEDDEHGYVEPEQPAPFGLTLIHQPPSNDPSGDPRVWHVPTYPPDPYTHNAA